MTDTTTPREGVCAKCSQTRPLFTFYVQDQPWDEPKTAWLCARDWSTADARDADGQGVARWLPPRRDNWSPWATPQLDDHRERPMESYEGVKVRDAQEA